MAIPAIPSDSPALAGDLGVINLGHGQGDL
jgi:hypothetical protein